MRIQSNDSVVVAIENCARSIEANARKVKVAAIHYQNEYQKEQIRSKLREIETLVAAIMARLV